jgi:hypothetical protein
VIPVPQAPATIGSIAICPARTSPSRAIVIGKPSQEGREHPALPRSPIEQPTNAAIPGSRRPMVTGHHGARQTGLAAA